MTIELFFRLLGSLALLIFGMKTMSDALQKLAGPSLRHILARMTGNRFSGMLTGTCQHRHDADGMDYVTGI